MSDIESHEVIVKIAGPVPEWCEHEIVRCRDCRYMFDWAYDVPMCKLWAKDDTDDYPVVELGGYCWKGERR